MEFWGRSKRAAQCCAEEWNLGSLSWVPQAKLPRQRKCNAEALRFAYWSWCDQARLLALEQVKEIRQLSSKLNCWFALQLLRETSEVFQVWRLANRQKFKDCWILLCVCWDVGWWQSFGSWTNWLSHADRDPHDVAWLSQSVWQHSAWDSCRRCDSACKAPCSHNNQCCWCSYQKSQQECATSVFADTGLPVAEHSCSEVPAHKSRSLPG